MAEQQTVAPATEEIAVGQIVEFTKYVGLEDDAEPLLNEGQRIIVSNITKDAKGNAVFEVRQVDDKDQPNNTIPGEQLWADEFKAIAVDAAPKPKRKVTTKRQAAAKATKEVEAKAEAKAEVKPKATKKATNKAANKADKKATPKAKKSTASKAKATPKAANKADIEPAQVEPAQTVDISEDVPVLMSAEGYAHDSVVAVLVRGTNNIVEVARNLSAHHEEIYFKLGGVLAKIHEDKIHVTAGFEDTAVGFQSYVEMNIGGLRRAYYLLNIYRKFRRAGISSEDLQGMGWTKARLLAQLDVETLEQDKADLLERGRNDTRNDLAEYIKTTYIDANSGNEQMQKNVYKFILFGDENAMVDRALAHARVDQPEDVEEKRRDSLAFATICSEYIMMNENVEGAATMVPEDEAGLLAAAERLGIQIQVVREDAEVVQTQPQDEG